MIGWTLALTTVVVGAAVAAVLLHRNGHTQGDDFALYLRQARSLFDGDIGDVVADNRFSVVNSGPVFSPIAYPWGWPLMLAPFVNRWGYDYDRLKLLEVAAFCVWLILVHGIVRRRAGRLLAIAVTAVVATAPALLVHTDQLLSEYPHAAVVAAFVWWMDRIKLRRPLIGATTRQLVVLGLLAAAAFNVRRESVVLVAVIIVVQLVELVAARRGRPPVPVPWRTVAAPYATFVGAVIGFQLLLPSMLFPDTGDGPRYVPDRIGDYAGVLTEHLGLGRHPLIGTVVLAAGGGRHGRRVHPPAAPRHPAHRAHGAQHARRQHPLPHGRPLLLPGRAVGAVLRRRRRSPPPRPPCCLAGSAGWHRPLAAVPLAFLVVVHLAVLPGDIADARDFDRAGRVAGRPDRSDGDADLRRRRGAHRAHRRRRLLPRPHDDAATPTG